MAIFLLEKQARYARLALETAGQWHHTEDGKVVAVWPGSHVAYARATRSVDPDAYEHGEVTG